MSRIGLVGASTLLGEELKSELGRRSDLWSDLRLLTFDEEDTGKVSEIDGAATFVNSLSAETVEGLDLLVVAGESAAGVDLEAAIPGEATVIIVAPDATPDGGVPLVDGVNLADHQLPESALGRRLLVSPHPAAIALSLLLRPLRELGVANSDGYLILPSTSRGQAGLDELLAQSRALLAFQSDLPREVFGRQLAFNVLPSGLAPQSVLDDVALLLEDGPSMSLQLLQAAVFHGTTLGLHLVVDGEAGIEVVRDALTSGSFVSVGDQDGLGPIDSAGSDDIVITRLVADGSGRPGCYWLSAIFDNLTRGGALNAVAIVEALSTLKTH